MGIHHPVLSLIRIFAASWQAEIFVGQPTAVKTTAPSPTALILGVAIRIRSHAESIFPRMHKGLSLEVANVDVAPPLDLRQHYHQRRLPSVVASPEYYWVKCTQYRRSFTLHDIWRR